MQADKQLINRGETDFMAINELSLPLIQSKSLTERLLGIGAIIGAPMLLLQFFFGVVWKNTGNENYSPTIAMLGILYIGGWICGAIEMFRQKVYGENLGAKIVFALQMIFLSLAFMFSVQETLGINYKNGGGTFFFLCDMGYPASHLFMFIVGIMIIRARNWKGFTKYAPFLVALALPLTIATGWFLGMIGGMLLFGGLTMTGLGIIGRKILYK